MKVEELHYELIRKWQLHNSYRDGLSDVEKDAVLNDAVRIYFERYAFGRPGRVTPIGAEQSMRRTDMLASLVETVVMQFPALPSNDGSYSLALPANYASMREAHVTTNCGKMFVRLYGHDKMMDVIRNKHRGPSKRFMRAIAFRRKEELHVFIPEGVTVESVEMYYYRQPAVIRLGTYPQIPDLGTPPGANLPKTQCDITEKYHSWVVDIAVEELCRIYGDVNRLNVNQQKTFDLS